MTTFERAMIFVLLGLLLAGVSHVDRQLDRKGYAQELGACIYSLEQANREIDRLVSFDPRDRFQAFSEAGR